MTPGARAQAAITLTDQVLKAWESEKRIPADKLLENYFKSHRYIGSKDRAAIGELFYWVLRHKAALDWWLARAGQKAGGRTYIYSALLLRHDYDQHSITHLSKDSQYSPDDLTADEMRLVAALAGESVEHPDMPDAVRLNYPAWMDAALRESFGPQFETAMHALSGQASTDLRVNTLKTTRHALQEALEQEGFESKPALLAPTCLRLARRGPVFTSPLFKAGHFEMQDEGSQLVAALVDAQPGQKVIDFCAGAGGKTLAIAAAMKNKGQILAWDTSEKRLSQIKPRLARAGVDNVRTHVIASENDAFIKRHKSSADRVLVDAPCSGSGTWRRNPDLKWRFTPKDIDEVLALQRSILRSAARLVKPGGRLIYATCSVFRNENERQVESFLKEVNNFRVVCAEKIWDKKCGPQDMNAVSYLWVTPHEDGVDGFFAAVLERVADKPL